MCKFFDICPSFLVKVKTKFQKRRERGRNYALTGHKNFNISKTLADIKKMTMSKSCFIFEIGSENIKRIFYFVEIFSKKFASSHFWNFVLTITQKLGQISKNIRE